LIARCAPLWNASPSAQELTGWIGGLTLLAGAILGCVQWDIKRILAYSTMSQIGYMVMGVGVGAYSAGVMHFYTHAFFKALMFLTSGLVIHALHDEQDVRRMGGLSRKMPFAFWCMFIGVIAICGILPVGGFFSKDAVLEGTLAHGHYILYAIGVFTAGLTGFYMFRMLFLVFFGEDRSDVSREWLGMPEAAPHGEHHAPSVPAWVMQAPVGVLAAGTLVCGLVAVPWGGAPSAWTNLLAQLFAPPVPGEEHLPFSEFVAVLITLAVSVAGIVAAYLRYGAPNARVRSVPGIAAEARGVPAILARRFYFDDAIDWIFVKPAVAIGDVISKVVEPRLIDGLVRDVVWAVNGLGLEVRALQSGLVRSYAFLMVGGVVVALAYFAWLGAAR
jgi:NADH-quinone oxidoreductase subunit L